MRKVRDACSSGTARYGPLPSFDCIIVRRAVWGVSTVPDCTRTYSRELLVRVEEEEGKKEDPLSYCSGASYGAYKYFTYRTRVPVT